MKTAQSIIEETYSIALNPNQDYFAQLEPLSANGELANHNSSLKLLLGLCLLIDAQGKQIKQLLDDREAMAKKMVELENKGTGAGGNYVKPISDSAKPDATQPL